MAVAGVKVMTLEPRWSYNNCARTGGLAAGMSGCYRTSHFCGLQLRVFIVKLRHTPLNQERLRTVFALVMRA